MATHRIYAGKGDQALVTVPHQDGRPVRVTSATYSIYDSRSLSEVIVPAGTAATVDAASTVLTNRAGRGSTDKRLLTVSSTTGFNVGHTYLLTGATGVVEIVRIVAVKSATGMLAASEIRGDFVVGSTIQGIEVAASFPADVADAEASRLNGPWILAWTIPGFAPLRETVFLHTGEEAQLATMSDLTELDPSLANVNGDRVDPALALSRAHKDLRTDLLLAGADRESDMLLGPIGRDAVVNLAAFYCVHHSDEDSMQKKADLYHNRYRELRAALLVGNQKSEVVALDKATGTKTASTARLFVRYGQ